MTNDHLAACVKVIETVMECGGVVWEDDRIADALEDAGIIMWNTVPPSGEIDAHFDGAEDLEPGDAYWTTTKKWEEMVAAANDRTT